MAYKTKALKRLRERQYRAANLEKLREHDRQYYRDHREAKKIKARAYYAAHAEHYRANAKAYYHSHKTDYKQRARKGYLRRKGLTCSLCRYFGQFWGVIKGIQEKKGCCYYIIPDARATTLACLQFRKNALREKTWA